MNVHITFCELVLFLLVYFSQLRQVKYLERNTNGKFSLSFYVLNFYASFLYLLIWYGLSAISLRILSCLGPISNIVNIVIHCNSEFVWWPLLLSRTSHYVLY